MTGRESAPCRELAVGVFAHGVLFLHSQEQVWVGRANYALEAAEEGVEARVRQLDGSSELALDLFGGRRARTLQGLSC